MSEIELALREFLQLVVFIKHFCS